jgi:hypothetical protein
MAAKKAKKAYPAALQAFFAEGKKYENAKLTRLAQYGDFYTRQFSDSPVVDGLLVQGKDLFNLLVKAGRLTRGRVSEYRERYVPILVDPDIDDWTLPFNALVVDTEKQELPVFLLGFASSGELKKVAPSLDHFVRGFILESLEPLDTMGVERALHEVGTLLGEGRHPEAIATANKTIEQLEKTRPIDDKEARVRKAALGRLYDLKGLAEQRVGERNARASFERALELLHLDARSHLMNWLCYEAGDYAEARKLSRELARNDDDWYQGVKMDAFASLQLGDSAQAERCYRLLHDKYRRSHPERIAEAANDLAKATNPLALSIRTWFGQTKTYTPEELTNVRSYFEALEPNWQKQLRVALKEPNGATERKNVAKDRQPLTDDALAQVLELRSLDIDKDYPVAGLEPLLGLPSLESLEARDIATGSLDPIGKLTQLCKLDLEDTEVGDGAFLRSLVNLRKLNLHAAPADVEPLRHLVHLEELSWTGKPIADLAPIAGLRALRRLSLRVSPRVTDLSFLSRCEHLRKLSIAGSGLRDLSSLVGCKRLTSLSLEDSEALSDVRAVAELTLLESVSFRHCKALVDIAPLGGLHKLKRVDVFSTSVQDVSALAGCPELESVNAFVETSTLTGVLDLAKCEKLFWLEIRRGTIDAKTEKRFGELKRRVLRYPY